MRSFGVRGQGSSHLGRATSVCKSQWASARPGIGSDTRSARHQGFGWHLVARTHPIVENDMFDGVTTPGLDLSASLVVLDLSALYSSAALGVLMACATAWLQAALARAAAAAGSASPGRFFLVVDEAWAILSNLEIVAMATEDGPCLDAILDAKGSERCLLLQFEALLFRRTWPLVCSPLSFHAAGRSRQPRKVRTRPADRACHRAGLAGHVRVSTISDMRRCRRGFGLRDDRRTASVGGDKHRSAMTSGSCASPWGDGGFSCTECRFADSEIDQVPCRQVRDVGLPEAR